MPDNYLNTSPLMQITDNQYILKMNIVFLNIQYFYYI